MTTRDTTLRCLWDHGNGLFCQRQLRVGRCGEHGQRMNELQVKLARLEIRRLQERRHVRG